MPLEFRINEELVDTMMLRSSFDDTLRKAVENLGRKRAELIDTQYYNLFCAGKCPRCDAAVGLYGPNYPRHVEDNENPMLRDLSLTRMIDRSHSFMFYVRIKMCCTNCYERVRREPFDSTNTTS